MLTVYGHYVSQPTRAVLWSLLMQKVPHTFIKINPVMFEAETPEYLAKFPTGVVPAIEDGDFCLTESNAILVYLAEKHLWDQWYPLAPARFDERARINQFLHWQHQNLRHCTSSIFRPKMLEVMGKKGANRADRLDATARIMRDNMLVLKFAGKLEYQPFLTGHQPTLADIAAYCELDQLYYGKLFDFAPYPEVLAWMERMQKLDSHDEVRRSLFKLCEKFSTPSSTL